MWCGWNYQRTDASIAARFLYFRLRIRVICDHYDQTEMAKSIMRLDTLMEESELKCKKHPKYQIKRPPRNKHGETTCRTCLFMWQRKTRGWDDSITWSVYTNFAEYIIPRLKRFREYGAPYATPAFLGPTEAEKLTKHQRNKRWDLASLNWCLMIDQMVKAFELLVRNDIPDDTEQKQINDGLELFSKHFQNLWW